MGLPCCTHTQSRPGLFSVFANRRASAGHSLGGALATIFAAALAAGDAARPALAARAHVYSYASPRVGDLSFADSFAKAYSDTGPQMKQPGRATNSTASAASINDAATCKEDAGDGSRSGRRQSATGPIHTAEVGKEENSRDQAGLQQGQAREGRAFRMHHGADIIPHVPPTWLEYAHVGEERFITSFGAVLSDPRKIKCCPTVPCCKRTPLAL